MQRFLLGVIAIFAVISFTQGETDCENHRRNAIRSHHGMQWNIECDEEGNYLPLQCNEEEKPEKQWCACYNKTDKISQYSRNTRQCDCPLAKNRAENENPPASCVPECENTGKWQTIQCCGGKCNCVNPDTGERTTEPTTDTDLACP